VVAHHRFREREQEEEGSSTSASGEFGEARFPQAYAAPGASARRHGITPAMRFPFRRTALVAGVLAITVPAAHAGPAPEPAPEAVIATLPFRPSNEPNRVVIDLSPSEGRRFEMMLDTGATASVVTPLMARDLGVSVRRTKRTPYRKSTVLGRDIQFWVDTKVSDSGSKTGWEYGLIGGDFFDDYVVEIDFPGRKVRFLDPKKYTTPESADAPDEAVIPVKIVANRILMPVELEGKQVELLLDTGTPDTMVLSGAAATKLGIDVAKLPDFGTGGTVLGPMEQRLHEAQEFRIGGFASGPFPVVVAPNGWYNQGAGNDSAIGVDAIRPFVLRIDYPRKRLWLKRTGDPAVTFFGADYAAAKKVGALLTPFRNAMHVYLLAPDGPAATYGLRNGDAIVPISGEKLPTLDEIVAKIVGRQELTVSRLGENDVWVDTILPADSP
jgi:hypothetical protein